MQHLQQIKYLIKYLSWCSGSPELVYSICKQTPKIDKPGQSQRNYKVLLYIIFMHFLRFKQYILFSHKLSKRTLETRFKRHEKSIFRDRFDTHAPDLFICISTVCTLNFTAEFALSSGFKYPQILYSLFGWTQNILSSDWRYKVLLNLHCL